MECKNDLGKEQNITKWFTDQQPSISNVDLPEYNELFTA